MVISDFSSVKIICIPTPTPVRFRIMGALKSSKCSKGHLMRGPNLYIRANGQRQCKACIDIRNKAYEKKRKAESRRRRAAKKLANGPKTISGQHRAQAAAINAAGVAEA